MSGWNQEQEYQAGVRAERERIIKLLEEARITEVEIGVFEPRTIKVKADALLVSDIIALIKGENACKHEQTLDWSQHCDCGTRHRDCRDCDWTEPCKPEGENK